MSKGFTMPLLRWKCSPRHQHKVQPESDTVCGSFFLEPQGNKHDRDEIECRAELESFFHLPEHHQRASIKANKHYDDPCINFLPSEVSIS